jgi:hypothetical protein
MALLILATVFLGFAQSYYLAGMLRAPLPNLLIHVHGAAFSIWILLFLVQTSVVTAGRVDVHRRLGLVGVGLASLMVPLGVLAAVDSLRRAPTNDVMESKAFLINPVTNVLLFGTLVFLAYRARSNATTHKRLILIGNIALLDAAINRWPFAFIQNGSFWVTEVCAYMFLLPLFALDIWSMRKLHPATIWGAALLIVVQQVRHPVAASPAWQTFATWALHVAKAVHGA